MLEGEVDRIAGRLRNGVGEHKVTVGEGGVTVVTKTGSGLKEATEDDIDWDEVLPTYVHDGDEGDTPAAKKNGKTPEKKGKNGKSLDKNLGTTPRKLGKA